MANDLENSYFMCYRPDYSLILLKCNRRLSIFGVFDVQVLYGKVLLRGYEFESGAYAEERFINVATPYSISPPAQFFSLPYDHSFSLHRVKWRLNELTNVVDSILEKFEKGDSILLFRFSFSKICACIRELNGEMFFLPPSTSNHCTIGPMCSILRNKYPLLYEDETASNITQLIEQVLTKSREGKRSVTMIVGNKGTGKSMLIRVIANSFLRKNRLPVYILDCDVGQPEMNPPGCVSLVKINSPLLGVPMFQQRIVMSDTYFYGRILLNDNASSYLVILRKLLQRFKNDSEPSSVLLINTCGWVEGKGAALLDKMLKLFDPDFVFNFLTCSGPNYTVQQSSVNGTTKPIVFSGNAVQKPVHIGSSSLTLRNLRIAAYMIHACPAPTIKSFADAAPFAISFRDVALLLHTSEPFPVNHIFAVLNCTLVALCVHNRSIDSKNEKRLFDDEEMPVLLNPDGEGPLRILGFGFIRAIDLEQHIFYVLSPLEHSIIQEVNVLARGLNINLPPYFLVSQEGAPYVVRNRSSSFDIELFKELRVKSCFHWKRFLKTRGQSPVRKSARISVSEFLN